MGPLLCITDASHMRADQVFMHYCTLSHMSNHDETDTNATLGAFADLLRGRDLESA
jgi:hypothetical protein